MLLWCSLTGGSRAHFSASARARERESGELGCGWASVHAGREGREERRSEGDGLARPSREERGKRERKRWLARRCGFWLEGERERESKRFEILVCNSKLI